MYFNKVRELLYDLVNGARQIVFIRMRITFFLTVQKNINIQQLHLNVYVVFCSQYSHQRVSSCIPAICRVMLLLQKYNCG